jgi:replicative DNA helicase
MEINAKFKVAPHSKESEMMILGCMLTNADSLKYAAQELEDADFFFVENKATFHAIQTAFKEGKPADVHLICERLKKNKQLDMVGGVAYIMTLAQYAGTSAYIEGYVEELKNQSLLRNVVSKSQEMEKYALDSNENAISLVRQFQNSLQEIEQRHGKKLPLISVHEHFNKLDILRNSFQGKKYLGLCVKSIPEINENLLGLRRLNLLAAAPNVGKTALTIQLGLEALMTNPDACLVYFSLEMTMSEIFTRMNLYFSEMDFKTFILGRQDSNFQSSYSKEEHEKILASKKILTDFDHRLQIIDTSSCPALDSRMVINYIETLKAKTMCKRCIVIIDYLQVWPVPLNLRFSSENEMDKWRMGEMKKIRHVMNEDPLIVISEARKPSGSNEVWGGDLSDVMGAARGTYTPDVVMMLSQLKPKALEKVWTKNGMPSIELDEDADYGQDEKVGLSIKNFLAKHGIAINKLEIPKGRDGMQKFTILIEFHFHKNIFKPVDWKTLKSLVKKNDTEKNYLFK